MKRLLVLAFFFPLLASAQHVLISAAGGQSHKTWHGQADVQALNIEIGKTFSPRTEVAFVVSPMSLWQPRSWFGDQFGDGNETVRAIAAAVLLRHRLNVDSSRIHFYGEVASGPMWAEKAIPASTSRFNFSTQFGTGIVLMPRRRYPLLVGYRFAHLSNGGYSPRNPGFNISEVVLGVQVRR
ncbi:MAG TPA: acyloxyacyl hydrolase [Thermoanaerobaculia bacterium]|nr:acyloxyacyl hydrolase [Thermoanaerobaculia bacterium]